MNGLDILQFYSNDKLVVECGGFCNLATYTVKIPTYVTHEDRQILTGIGWEYKGLRTWYFEEWT